VSPFFGLMAVVREAAGICAVQQHAGLAQRVRNLVAAKASPHPLFDAGYYAGPLLDFLMRGGFAGRKPHPLFDPHWYLLVNPDVAEARINPLQHYVNAGWREGRIPHPLFDPQWYRRQVPKARSCDPLVHFLQAGGRGGGKPHPLFDSDWYVRTYPEVEKSGMNPLVHYLVKGAAEGKEPNPRFSAREYREAHPEAAESGVDALTHLVTETYFRRKGMRTGGGAIAARTAAAAPKPLRMRKHGGWFSRRRDAWSNPAPSRECPVLVVYGRSNVEFIERHLLPALAAQRGSFRLHLHTLNYRNSECLLSAETLKYRGGNLDGVTDWSEKREGGHIGFGEAVNYLFERVAPETHFLLVNPDSMPMEGCVGRLLEAFSGKNAAMVEARQWPREHPKEFDTATGETPWATGAFVLIASEAFRRLGGFDPIYFLYNEDVDLSWRAWLEGMPVMYEPAALCAHFTGRLAHDFHRFQREQFFSIRNFLLLAYKFFGERGERMAREWMRAANLPQAFQDSIERSYAELRGKVRRVEGARQHREKIKILGLNLYHELRPV
jgi:GT2 family glycosyltransferase